MKLMYLLFLASTLFLSSCQAEIEPDNKSLTPVSLTAKTATDNEVFLTVAPLKRKGITEEVISLYLAQGWELQTIGKGTMVTLSLLNSDLKTIMGEVSGSLKKELVYLMPMDDETSYVVLVSADGILMESIEDLY